MRHESWGAGEGTRGSEGKQKGEWDRRRDIGVTGGSGDCQNREEKRRKKVILSQSAASIEGGVNW